MANLAKEAKVDQSVAVEDIEAEVATPIFLTDSHIISMPSLMDMLLNLRMHMEYDRTLALTVLQSSNLSTPRLILLLVGLVEVVHHAHSLFQTLIAYTLGFHRALLLPLSRFRLSKQLAQSMIILLCRL